MSNTVNQQISNNPSVEIKRQINRYIDNKRKAKQ